MTLAQKENAARLWMCRGRRPVSFVTISCNVKDPPSHLGGLICWLATAAWALAVPWKSSALLLPSLFTDCEIKTRHEAMGGWSACAPTPLCPLVQLSGLLNSGQWAKETQTHRPGAHLVFLLIFDPPSPIPVKGALLLNPLASLFSPRSHSAWAPRPVLRQPSRLSPARRECWATSICDSHPSRRNAERRAWDNYQIRARSQSFISEWFRLLVFSTLHYIMDVI